MENLLPTGVAALLPRDNDLHFWSHSHFMNKTTHIVEGMQRVENAIASILSASDSLISQLTAPERLIVRSIKERHGGRS